MDTSPPAEIALLLRQGISAARAGRPAEARQMLRQAIAADPNNEMAWLWLSSLMETDEQKRTCLERVLHVNPENTYARAGLKRLTSSSRSETDILETRLASVTGGSTPGPSYQPKSTDKPTIKELASSPSPKQPSANGSNGTDVAVNPPDHTPPTMDSTPPSTSLETTCPVCDLPISVTAIMCPRCYTEFRPQKDLPAHKDQASAHTPALPSKSRPRGIRGLFALLIS